MSGGVWRASTQRLFASWSCSRVVWERGTYADEVLPQLFERLYPALDALGRSYEIVFVNDGSRDRSVALMRDGKVVFMLERRDIESRDPGSIADELTTAFDRFCAPATAPATQ